MMPLGGLLLFITGLACMVASVSPPASAALVIMLFLVSVVVADAEVRGKHLSSAPVTIEAEQATP